VSPRPGLGATSAAGPSCLLRAFMYAAAALLRARARASAPAWATTDPGTPSPRALPLWWRPCRWLTGFAPARLLGDDGVKDAQGKRRGTLKHISGRPKQESTARHLVDEADKAVV
jgi:hypothetical protein